MSTRYQLYVANTLKLVESLIIKSDDSIDGLNQWVIDYYGLDKVNKNNPESWKYYLNISGEYHFTNTPMEVVSWDTLETIVFNKTNLDIHRATFKAYEYGSIQYMELVNKYPNQELLIRGILDPVNIHTAINVPNGSVLGYDETLIEENEYSLIQDIDQWIKSFKVRYVNEQYNISDELYAATHHAIMYLQLIPAILNFRLKRCKTNEAHSYHIMEYLLSHGLPEYSVMHMTKKQMLFFYRNIKYIQRNAGSIDTFKWIIDHIMTERFLPLSEYVMKHNWEKQIDTLLPTVHFRNNNLNSIYGAADQDHLTTSMLLMKEDKLALGNPQYREEELDHIEKQFAYSKSSTVMTKVLESTIIDYSESGQNRPEEILLQHWLYLSVIGKYKAYVRITNPKTDEQIPLSAKDAFTLMIYAFAKSMGIDLIYVPMVVAKRVIRTPLPTVTELMKLVDSSLVKPSVAEEMLSYMPTLTDIISTESFNAFGNKVFTALTNQLKLPAVEEHYYARGLVNNMVYGMYCDVLCELEPVGTMYEVWFNEKVLDFSGYSQQEFDKLYQQIVEDVTGIDLIEEPNLMSLQAAMIKLLEYLSSYSVQFVKKINNNGLISLNYHPVRCGDMVGASSAVIEFYDAAIDLIDQSLKTKANLIVDIDDDDDYSSPTGVQEIISIKDRMSLSIDMDANITFEPNIVHCKYEFDSAPLYVNSIEVVPL